MSETKSVLVIVDTEDPDSPAIRRAEALATATGALLRLAAFVYERTVAGWGLADPWLMGVAIEDSLEAVEHSLRAKCEALAARGLQCDHSVLWAHPMHTAIVAQVVEEKPDLVIKDVGRAPFLPPGLLTPLDWHLLRLCPQSLMLVKTQSTAVMGRVLAAVDPVSRHHKPEELNARIVETALALGRQSGAEVHLLAAFNEMPPLPYYTLDFSRAEQLHQERSSEAKSVMTALAAANGVPEERCHFVWDSVIENAVQKLCRRLEADVLVLGTTYRHGLKQAMIGTVAEKILYAVDCDIVAVKPEPFSGEMPAWLDLSPADVALDLETIRQQAATRPDLNEDDLRPQRHP